MHPVLVDSLQRFERHYAADARCTGMYLWGSLGNGTADTWSDVDVAAVFQDADFAAAKEEFRQTCAALCGPLLVVLPEGEQPGYINFAFLFHAEERLHLYDFTVLSVGFMQQTAWVRPQKILFDKAGLLAEAGRRQPPAAAAFTAAQLRQLIDAFWVYAYLNGKYGKRQDLYKMLYVQDVLLQMHVKVLRAFHPDQDWNWWPRDIHLLGSAQQAEFMAYFGTRTFAGISTALWREFDLFSRDAQAACAVLGIAYPAELEQGVRQHLRQMGVVAGADAG